MMWQRFRSYTRFLTALTACLSMGLACVAHALEPPPPPPRIAAANWPLHAIAAAVTEGIGTAEGLAPAGMCAHDSALTPAMGDTLRRADLVLMIDEKFESALAENVRALAPKARILQLAHADGVKMAQARETESAAWHLWLNPDNAGRIAEAIAKTLMEMDPARAPRYKENAVRFRQSLEQTDGEIQTRLYPLTLKLAADMVPYLRTEDISSYPETHYKLPAALETEATLTLPVRAKIGEALAGKRLACVITLPGQGEAVWRRVANDFGAKLVALPVEGVENAPANAAGYFAFMRTLGDAYASCLAAAGQKP